jgi:hypothetical protein
VKGDINATGVGTVTRVMGSRLIGFGHPMLNAGQPGLPTCTARVLHVLASEQRSFKIAEPEVSLGAMVHDRQSAVVVDTSVKAATVPLAVRLHGAPPAQRSTWNAELASHRMLTPMFAFSTLASALSASAIDQTDVTFRATSRVQVAGHGVVEVSDVGYSPVGAAGQPALGQLRLFPLFEAVYGNPFESVAVERVEVDVDIRFERDVVTLLDALAPSAEVDPGRDLSVYLTLRRFGQSEESRKVTIPIPASAAGQRIEVAFEPGNRVQLERPDPTSLDELLANVKLGYPATSLVISMKLPNQGLNLRGQVVRGLPASALDTLQVSAGAARPVAFPTQVRTELPLGHVVDGSARITIDVRQQPLR